VNADWPLVTVVMPSLNQSRFIEEAVRSVLEQDHPQVELVVVDGGSADGTLDILRRYEGIRLISEPDDGQADALRKGFALAGGEIFGWLNADDTYLPGAVSAAVALLQSGGYGLVYGGYRVVHQNGETAFDVPPHEWNLELLLDSKNFVPQPSAFFTRAAYEAVGGVDPRYHYAMDYDLWVRLGRRVDVGVVDGLLSCFRFQSESKSVTAAEQFYPEMRKISRRNGGRFFSSMYMHRLPERRPLLFRLVLVYRLVGRAGRRLLGR